MKIEGREIVQGLVIGLLLAILAAAGQTYVEVKMLRHDVDRIEGIIDNLVDEATKK